MDRLWWFFEADAVDRVDFERLKILCINPRTVLERYTVPQFRRFSRSYGRIVPNSGNLATVSIVIIYIRLLPASMSGIYYISIAVTHSTKTNTFRTQIEARHARFTAFDSKIDH